MPSRYVKGVFVVFILASVLLPGPGRAGGNTTLPEGLGPWSQGYLMQKSRPFGTLIVHVSGLDPPRGVLRLAVYGSRSSYRARKDPVRAACTEISSSNATLVFQDMEAGWYAIMMYHDTNRNNKFDRFLGFPREQYGFSNNALPGIGPPDFKYVKFKVEARKLTVQDIRAR